MNKEIAKKWVAALRSGEYKQGKGRLRRNNPNGRTSFCCLGVLCNLHAQAHPRIAAKQKDPGSYMDNPDALPEPVRMWAGMRDDRGQLPNGDLLTELNDRGWSFKAIAGLIEANVKAL